MMSRACKLGIASVQLAFALLLAGGLIPVSAQDPPLKSLYGVLRVAVTWTGGSDADRNAIQTDVEFKLRQAGMTVATADQQVQPFFQQSPNVASMLFVGVGGGNAALPVTLELHERVYSLRDLISTMKTSALDAYVLWHDARMKEPSPITEAEMKEHMAPVLAESKENLCLSSSTPMRDVTTWQRHGMAQATQHESVRDIIARYNREAQGFMAPVMQHEMDLEVQSAMAEAQRPASPGTVRDTIKGYVDQFLNEWSAANPRAVR
jgi:hypothetical protein